MEELEMLMAQAYETVGDGSTEIVEDVGINEKYLVDTPQGKHVYIPEDEDEEMFAAQVLQKTPQDSKLMVMHLFNNSLEMLAVPESIVPEELDILDKKLLELIKKA